MFDNLELYFDLLKRNSPARDYYPDPTKIVMIVNSENIKVGELFGVHRGFAVFVGTLYIDSYIRDDESK